MSKEADDVELGDSQMYGEDDSFKRALRRQRKAEEARSARQLEKQEVANSKLGEL